ncbi:MAG: ABC transporter permease, partial [Rhodobacteraceae bacterium]|nr:ABC transporter permease [Paracoccaceae bacterium]
MTTYFIRRLFGAILVMWAVSTLVFFMLRLVPGDPIAAMLADAGGPDEIAILRNKLGLDQPVIVQYGKWFSNLWQGDFGTSIYGSRLPVAQILSEAIPRTMSLALIAFVVALGIGL